MSSFRHPRRALALAALLVLSAFDAAAQAVSYREVAALQPEQGSMLVSALARGADGRLYGTASQGGAFGMGSVYRVEADGSVTVLHSFAADGSEGVNPVAGLLLASDGWFYGSTSNGTRMNGSIFRISPAGEFVQVQVFTGAYHGPDHTLIQDAAGNFYGDLVDTGYGAIFKMTPDHAITVLHRFTDGQDGGLPSGPLLLAQDGTLYGTAQVGPAGSCGEVFAIPPGGHLHVLHAFAPTPAPDGCLPMGTLAEGRDHRLYGTTFYQGGGDHAEGTVFSLSHRGAFAVAHTFELYDPLGSEPSGGLVAGADGTLYGTTAVGAASNGGAVFALSPKGWGGTVLHAFEYFTATDGVSPAAAPTLLPGGALAGTTRAGGAGASGTVYQVDPSN